MFPKFIDTQLGFSSLLLNVFFQAQIISNSMAAGASPQTPLGELTALPQALSCFSKGSYF